jgi:hypothetical protein
MARSEAATSTPTTSLWTSGGTRGDLDLLVGGRRGRVKLERAVSGFGEDSI